MTRVSATRWNGPSELEDSPIGVGRLYGADLGTQRYYHSASMAR